MGETRPLDIALTDSWEAGQQNWTPAMFEEFRRTPRLRPAPVDARAHRPHRRQPRDAANQRACATSAARSRTSSRTPLRHARRRRAPPRHDLLLAGGRDRHCPLIVDGLQAKGRVDVPTGEFWVWPGRRSHPLPDHLVDVREAASAAHIYGKRLVAAESLTTRGEDPFAQGPAAVAAHGGPLLRRRRQQGHPAHLRASAIHRPRARHHAASVRPAFHAQ